MFNAFKYTKQLEEAGFSREQAEIQLQVMTEIVEGDLATKQDIVILNTSVKQVEAASLQAINSLEVSFKQEMKLLEVRLMNFVENKISSLELRFNNLENKVQQLEYRLTIKVGALLIIGFSTMATLLKFWLIQ